ncbi:hypothetical protein D0T11_15720 [Hymenobacter rubripertinctus]|uniref:Uncharacterized protein n=1 Tax=Hymenobacter rubripertinctus TaxID=2029981 RepID=A0A418QRS0_9BACT|nr:hypothetical protein D0T11_15720 [Hymenobacter rubripertinctus]
MTTPAECDAALALAQDRQRVLRQRELVTGYQRENKELSATEVSAEMASLAAEIDYLTPLIPTLPVSVIRTKREDTLRRLTDRRDELVSRQGSVGPVALLTRELEQGETTARLAEIDDFVAAVTARKAVL